MKTQFVFAVTGVVSLAAVALSGCRMEPMAGNEETGEIRTRVTSSLGSDPNAAAALPTVKIDVLYADEVIASQSIQTEDLPPTDGKPGADGFFVLPAGEYQVQASVLGQGGRRDETCSMAETNADVEAGHTTEVELALFCGESGGLDVLVSVDQEPLIEGLTISPSKFVKRCEVVTITAKVDTSYDTDFAYQWRVTEHPAGAVYTLGEGEALGNDRSRTTFQTRTAGSYELEFKVTDETGRVAKLTFPIHVANEGPANCCE